MVGMDVRAAAAWLREEMESCFPETMKVPGRQGGYIRVAVSVNTEWYRRFCRAHSKPRSRRYPKVRPFVKRCHTIACLRRIEAGSAKGVYAERLMPFVAEAVERMQER